MPVVCVFPECMLSLGVTYTFESLKEIWPLSPENAHVAFYRKFLNVPRAFVGHQLTCGFTTVHRELFRRHLRNSGAGQFRIRDGDLGFTCIEVSVSAIEATKVAKRRSRTKPQGGPSWRKVRRQRRVNGDTGVPNQKKKLFKDCQKP